MKDKETTSTSSSLSDVIFGPDLNKSKGPLDKKLYRQILLTKNGLKCVLISDTLALGQQLKEREEEDQRRKKKIKEENDGMEEGGEEEEESHDDDTHEHENDDNGSQHDDDDDNGYEHADEDTENEEEEDNDDDDEEEGLRKAAAALLVQTGSSYDPPHLHGLAHFLEHMLFMGTSKYPTENYYDSHLSTHGGSDNAYTELEYTVYHFEIPMQSLLEETLDIFSQFFVQPLLLEEAVERELQSIESEFRLSETSDECRLQQLLCFTCGKGEEEHCFNKFSWGNYKSLKEEPEKHGIDRMAELRKFYNQYYYAANMRLVVIGAYSLDELQEQVVRCFSDVPALPRETSSLATAHSNTYSWEETSCHSPLKDHGMPFATSALGRIYRVVPVRDRHSLNITWQVPPQGMNWRSKPCDYIAHLLGHEAGGSLLSALKERSLATACFAGVGSVGHENASSHALFVLTFTLSEEGVSHWAEIVTEVYRYIGMIRYYCALPDGLPPWIYEELRAIQDIAYKFEDEMTPEELVENIVEDLAPCFSLPPERLLDGNSLLFEYDGEAIKNIVDNFLTPRNARVDLMSSTFGRDADYDGSEEINVSSDGNILSSDEKDSGGEFSIENMPPPQKEPMFQTKFWSQPFSETLLKEWESAALPCLPPDLSALSLPPLNPFVPTKFDLKPLPIDDMHHPLLHCSLKILDTETKGKAWLSAKVTNFNRAKKQILLSYEDENEKWHEVDLVSASASDVTPDFEGTLDNDTVKFKIVALPKGEESATGNGENGNFYVDIGITFPPIPPPLPESRLPQLVANTQALRLWHLQDQKFKRPIAELRLKVVCSHANRTPLHRACADLFVALCQDSVTEISYLASVCELGSSIASTDQGFTLRVHGFDHKLLDLASEVLEVFLSFRDKENQSKLPDTIKSGRFDACLEVLLRRYANAGMQASSLCTDVRLRCIRPTIWSSHSKADALKDINESTFMETVSSILSELSVEAFYHGNVDYSDAESAKSVILNALAASGTCGLPKEKYPSQHVLKTPLATDHHVVITPTKDSKEPNTAVEVYFQVGKDDLSHRILIDLLSQIMYEPLFDELRTKEQFGYHVSCGARWTYGVMGISFKVVTSCKSANEVSQRLDTFLHEFRDKLASMEDEKFMENLVGLAKNKLQMYNSLEEECNSLWSEINEGRYEWEIYRNEAARLRTVTKENVLTAFDNWLSPKCEKGESKKRRRLVVHVIGTSEGPASVGRPTIATDKLGHEIDQRVQAFHKATGHDTWGKIL